MDKLHIEGCKRCGMKVALGSITDLCHYCLDLKYSALENEVRKLAKRNKVRRGDVILLVGWIDASDSIKNNTDIPMSGIAGKWYNE